MFSNRTAFGTAPNRIARALERRRRTGKAYVDLTESNPTRVGLPVALEPLAELASSRELAAYEPEPFGRLTAREAVCRYYADLGADVKPAQVLLSASTSEAYAWLFKTLCDPGDELLVPQPSYPLFEFLATLEAVKVVPYGLRYDGEWHVESASLDTAISPRTRAIVVVSPNNPTGSLLKHDELALLVDRCRSHGLALIADEVFADYAQPHARAAPTLAGMRDVLAFTLSGVSKVCALPQLKLAWTVVSGPPREVDEALARLETVADTYLSVSAPAQLALPRLLANREQVQAALRERLRANFKVLLKQHTRASPWQVLTSEGGWTAVLKVARTRTDEEWVLKLLEQHSVLVHPGHLFDFPSDGYLVVSLLPETSAFATGAARVAEALGE